MAALHMVYNLTNHVPGGEERCNMEVEKSPHQQELVKGTVVRLWEITTLPFRAFFDLLRAVHSWLFGSPVRTTRQQRVLRWIQGSLPERDIPDLDAVWKDGALLCQLVDMAVPGSCLGWSTLPHVTLHHGQITCCKYLGLPPAFNTLELLQEHLTPALERKLVRYLCAVQRTIESLNSDLEDAADIPVEPSKPSVAVRGMGLILGVRERRAVFVLHLLAPAEQQEDILVSLQGPGRDYGSVLITLTNASPPPSLRTKQWFPTNKVPNIPIDYKIFPDRVRISYRPKSVGLHELSIIKNSAHVPGSPFTVTVEENVGDMPPSLEEYRWQTPEEELRVATRKTVRVIFRVVDFVGEKMLLSEDGKLCPITAENFLEMEAASRARAVSDSELRKRLQKRRNDQPMDVLLRENSADDSKFSPRSFMRVVNEASRARYKKIVDLCSLLLTSNQRNKSMELLNTAEQILDGRPVRMNETTDTLLSKAINLIKASGRISRASSPSVPDDPSANTNDASGLPTERDVVDEVFTSCNSTPSHEMVSKDQSLLREETPDLLSDIPVDGRLNEKYSELDELPTNDAGLAGEISHSKEPQNISAATVPRNDGCSQDIGDASRRNQAKPNVIIICTDEDGSRVLQEEPDDTHNVTNQVVTGHPIGMSTASKDCSSKSVDIDQLSESVQKNDRLSELQDLLGENFKSYKNPSTSHEADNFNLWASDEVFGNPSSDDIMNLVDFDSILSAPNLDEALRKLDIGLENARSSSESSMNEALGLKQLKENDSTSASPCPSSGSGVSCAESSCSEGRYCQGNDDNEYGDNSPDNGNRQNLSAGDSAYLSMDDLQPSLDNSPQNEENQEGKLKRARVTFHENPVENVYTISPIGDRDLDEEDRKSMNRMGPAEKEIWGIVDEQVGSEGGNWFDWMSTRQNCRSVASSPSVVIFPIIEEDEFAVRDPELPTYNEAIVMKKDLTDVKAESPTDFAEDHQLDSSPSQETSWVSWKDQVTDAKRDTSPSPDSIFQSFDNALDENVDNIQQSWNKLLEESIEDDENLDVDLLTNEEIIDDIWQKVVETNVILDDQEIDLDSILPNDNSTDTMTLQEVDAKIEGVDAIGNTDEDSVNRVVLTLQSSLGDENPIDNSNVTNDCSDVLKPNEDTTNHTSMMYQLDRSNVLDVEKCVDILSEDVKMTTDFLDVLEPVEDTLLDENNIGGGNTSEEFTKDGKLTSEEEVPIIVIEGTELQKVYEIFPPNIEGNIFETDVGSLHSEHNDTIFIDEINIDKMNEYAVTTEINEDVTSVEVHHTEMPENSSSNSVINITEEICEIDLISNECTLKEENVLVQYLDAGICSSDLIQPSVQVESSQSQREQILTEEEFVLLADTTDEGFTTNEYVDNTECHTTSGCITDDLTIKECEFLESNLIDISDDIVNEDVTQDVEGDVNTTNDDNSWLTQISERTCADITEKKIEADDLNARQYEFVETNLIDISDDTANEDVTQDVELDNNISNDDNTWLIQISEGNSADTKENHILQLAYHDTRQHENVNIDFVEETVDISQIVLENSSGCKEDTYPVVDTSQGNNSHDVIFMRNFNYHDSAMVENKSPVDDLILEAHNSASDTQPTDIRNETVIEPQDGRENSPVQNQNVHIVLTTEDVTCTIADQPQVAEDISLSTSDEEKPTHVSKWKQYWDQKANRRSKDRSRRTNLEVCAYGTNKNNHKSPSIKIPGIVKKWKEGFENAERHNESRKSTDRDLSDSSDETSSRLAKCRQFWNSLAVDGSPAHKQSTKTVSSTSGDTSDCDGPPSGVFHATPAHVCEDGVTSSRLATPVEQRIEDVERSSTNSDEDVEASRRISVARQFFQSLEQTSCHLQPILRKQRTIATAGQKTTSPKPHNQQETSQKSTVSPRMESPTFTFDEQKAFQRTLEQSRRSFCDDSTISSEPTSLSDHFVDKVPLKGGSERIGKKRVSERFHVKNLFQDVVHGSSDWSPTNTVFRGIPNRQAVLAALKSVEDEAESRSGPKTPYEDMESNQGQQIASSFDKEFPYLPKTPPSKVKPRGNLTSSDLIPRKRLLKMDD